MPTDDAAGGDDTGDDADDAETYRCDDCGAEFGRSEATRTETMGDLDADTWQTLCCPTCGARVKTVFVGGS